MLSDLDLLNSILIVKILKLINFFLSSDKSQSDEVDHYHTHRF
jgi:hypothetical protein